MWSWLLTVVGVFGIFLIGQKRIVGWVVLVVSELLWIWYAIDTAQYGFVAGALIYGAVYLVSFHRWAKDAYPA